MSMWIGYNEFTVELGSGKEVTAEVECCVINDSNYGADADGNRGISMTWIDSLELTIPIAEWGKDDNGNEISQEEKVEAQRLIIKLAEDFNWQGQIADEYQDKEDY